MPNMLSINGMKAWILDLLLEGVDLRELPVIGADAGATQYANEPLSSTFTTLSR